MNQLITINSNNISMTSKEISELVEKRHDNVKRTIEGLVEQKVISRPQFEDGIKSANGIIEKVYVFSGEQGKRDSIIVVAQLSPEFTARLVDRWQELENNLAPPMTPELQIAHAMLLAGKMIEEQKLLIAQMKPKADFFDAVTDSTDAVDMACAAKVLNMGIGRTKLFEFLRDEEGILQKNNQPYQTYIDRGYFRVIESSYTKPDGSTHIYFKTIVYQKGLDFIRKRYAAYKTYKKAI